MQRAVFGFDLADAVRHDLDRPAIDPQTAVAHGDAVAGRPTTRFTQICDRSPGQRNTTMSPRSGSAARMRCVSGRVMKGGSEAAL